MHDYTTCPLNDVGCVDDHNQDALRTQCQVNVDRENVVAVPGNSTRNKNITRRQNQTRSENMSTSSNTTSSDHDLRSEVSVWRKGWTTPAAILGLYLLSLVCAIAHYNFFFYLDGRILSRNEDVSSFKSTAIPQTYVTIISLLLVTTFRAALVGSIGICYTQSLWRTLRSKVLGVRLIEDLFQVQRNVLRFMNYSLILRTPFLACIAAFCWLIPIGMIYPPGALIVELEVKAVDARFNVSVLYQEDFEPDPRNMSNDLRFNRYTSYNCSDYGNEAMMDDGSWVDSCEATLSNGPLDLSMLTRVTMMTGEISHLTAPAGENSSYNLDYWAPSLRCQESNQTILFNVSFTDQYGNINTSPTKYYSSDNGPYVWAAVVAPMTELTYDRWNNPDLNPPMDLRGKNWSEVLTLHFREGLQIKSATNWFTYPFYPCPKDFRVEEVPTNAETSSLDSISFPQMTVLAPTRKVNCAPILTKHRVNITYTKGVQKILHSETDEQPRTRYHNQFRHFNGTFSDWIQLSDALTIYDSFAHFFNSTSAQLADIYLRNITSKDGSYLLPNGSTVETCRLETINSGGMVTSDSSEFWRYSVLGRIPAEALTSDQQLVREALANVTISALSLNRRYSMVNGTDTRTFNVYHFKHKLVLLLPYTLSLILAIPMIVLGFIALDRNGVTAMSGGFLQVLMTTTGRTSLEKVAVRGCLGGQENVSKELEDIEVRFGELIVDVDEDKVAVDRSANINTSSEYRNLIDTATEHTAAETTWHTPKSFNEQDEQKVNLQYAEQATGIEYCEPGDLVVHRATFGTVKETRPLRRDRLYG